MINESASRPATRVFRSRAFIALLLVLITLAVYLPVRNYEFTNYDDQDYVTANKFIKDGFSLSAVKWAFTSGYASNWHPVTWLSHMLDVQLFGLDPGAHHLTNVVLHAAATLFLFLALVKLTDAPWQSGFVAALFALHPMHVESVAWIAERKDVLSAFFATLTLLCYGEYVKVDCRTKGLGFFALALVSFALGLMAKPMLVTLPCVLLLLDFWPLRRTDNLSLVRRILEKLPFFALSIASSIVTFIVQRSSGSVRTLDYIPLDSRILNSLIAYCRYIGKLCWPSDLAVFYPMPDYVSGWLGLVAGVSLLGLTILLFALRKRRPELLVGWLWFIGMLVPVIGIVQVGAQSMADRYSYLPSIGLFIIITWGGCAWLRRIVSQKFLSCIAFVVLASSACATAQQIRYWKNTITLFENALDVTKDNFVAHINLGSSLMQQKQFDRALKHYNDALALNGDVFEAHYGAAVILESQGKLTDAAEHFRAAVRSQPRHSVAHNNLGNVFLKLAKTNDALAEFSAAIDADPNCAEAQYNIGVVLADLGHKEEAISHYAEVVRIKPDYADAHNNLAVTLASIGKFEAAAQHLEQVLRLRPTDAEAHFNLSVVLKKLGKPDEARRHIEMAFQLNPQLMQNR